MRDPSSSIPSIARMASSASRSSSNSCRKEGSEGQSEKKHANPLIIYQLFPVPFLFLPSFFFCSFLCVPFLFFPSFFFCSLFVFPLLFFPSFPSSTFLLSLFYVYFLSFSFLFLLRALFFCSAFHFLSLPSFSFLSVPSSVPTGLYRPNVGRDELSFCFLFFRHLAPCLLFPYKPRASASCPSAFFVGICLSSSFASLCTIT